MKIFLNDRVIEFLPNVPSDILPSDRVADFSQETHNGILNGWEEFSRYDKYRRLLVVDPAVAQGTDSAAWISFQSIFKSIQAAGGLVRNEKGEFLFIHRFGYWDLPKGKIEKNDCSVCPEGKRNLLPVDAETAARAATREVTEETGIGNLTVGRRLPDTWHIYFQKEKWILKKTYWFEMTADSAQPLKPQVSEGIFLVKWTPPRGIHCILSHTYASLREMLIEVVL